MLSYIYDDKLVFTYNFKDVTETITLEEIEAAFGSDLNQSAPPLKRAKVNTLALLLFRAVFRKDMHNIFFINVTAENITVCAETDCADIHRVFLVRIYDFFA